VPRRAPGDHCYRSLPSCGLRCQFPRSSAALPPLAISDPSTTRPKKILLSVVSSLENWEGERASGMNRIPAHSVPLGLHAGSHPKLRGKGRSIRPEKSLLRWQIECGRAYARTGNERRQTLYSAHETPFLPTDRKTTHLSIFYNVQSFVRWIDMCQRSPRTPSAFLDDKTGRSSDVGARPRPHPFVTRKPTRESGRTREAICVSSRRKMDRHMPTVDDLGRVVSCAARIA